MKRYGIILLLILVLTPMSVIAITAEEVIKNYYAAFFYPGEDLKARVVMKLISREGKERIRELTMLRKNFGGTLGEQKYFIYFFQPADVRNMTFIVYKYPTKNSDRWIYIPALDMVRQIAATDARSSFVGSDFTYEDVSGRNLVADTYNLLREEKARERDCYVVESIPKGPIDYIKRISWIDKTTFLPLREEFYDVQNELYRIFTADKIEEIIVKTREGKEQIKIPTIIRRTMENLKNGHRTEVVFISVFYNIGIKDDVFSERYLRNPPHEWLK